jgi:hypothetical protein
MSERDSSDYDSLGFAKTPRSWIMAWTGITHPKYRRDGLRYASDTTDEEWAVIEPHMSEHEITAASVDLVTAARPHPAAHPKETADPRDRFACAAHPPAFPMA